MFRNLQKINPNFKYAAIIVVVFAVWMLTGIFGDKTPPENTPTNPNATARTATPSVATTTITPQSYARMLNLPAQTGARFRSIISAQTNGRITTLNVENGSVVKKGQHLATLDAGERRVQLASAKASLAAATQLATSARTLAADGYMSATTLAEREAAEAEAKARMQNIQQDLTYTHIVAPIDGVVENRKVSVGDLAAIGTPLLEIVNRNELLLTAYIPQRERSRVQLGQQINATLITGEKITGVVDFIATDANANSRTYRVDMAVDGGQFNIPTGMTAEVHIPTGAVPAYRVPHSAAILGDNGTLGIMLAINGKAQFTPITVLEDTPENLVVTGAENNLTGPINVITRGQLAITNGAAITVEQ